MAQEALDREPIRTVRGVRALGVAEANESRPVHLRGVVSFYDPVFRSLFLQDATGGIYVSMEGLAPLPLREGTELELIGVSGAGDFARIVLHPHVRILGQSKAPLVPVRLTTEMLKTGAYDSEWVEMEGVVHSVDQIGRRSSVRIKTSDGYVTAVSGASRSGQFERFVGATIRIRGVAGVYYNKRHQMTGVHLFLGSSSDIHVVHPAGGDGFDLPIRRIGQLAEYDPNAKPLQRVHLRGRATLVWPDVLICLQDEGSGICTKYTASEKFAVGMLVDAVGFPVFAAQQPEVEDVTLRRAAGSIEPPVARVLTTQAAMQGEGAGTLISMEGEFVGVKANVQARELLFRSGGVVFSAVAPVGDGANEEPNLAVGSKVRITGIDIAEVDLSQHGEWTSEQRVSSLLVLMRTWRDVTVLQTPSWWSESHMIYVGCCGSAGVLVILCWAALLRMQVGQRTKELQASEERYRMLAHHDVLTGAPNRALFYESSAAMLARAQLVRGRFAVMLLDMDQFKPINDLLGHEAGDKVLCTVVERASAALSAGDMVARLGGDEFAVLLELGPSDGVMRKAQRVRRSICQPLVLEGRVVAVSASVGIAVYPEDGTTLGELLRNADTAMYRSKQRGSGDVERFGKFVESEEDEGTYAVTAEEAAQMV